MEDAHTTILRLDEKKWTNWSYFGVFDGHAGSRTAIRAAEKLHIAIVSSLNSAFVDSTNSKSNSPISSSQIDLRQFEMSIKDAYFKFDEEWRDENRNQNSGD